jgi:Ca2+-binding EF-hand superfamily protein
VPLIVFLFTLTGCSSDDSGPVMVDKKTPPTYMLYSPNAEPLNGGPLGKPSCEQAMNGWFDRISAGSGHISQQIFLSDAQLQFKRMDIDHNGYIVSEELDRFRLPFRQQPPAALPEDPDSKKSGKSHGKHKDKEKAARSDPSLSMSDPVMSADTNLDFKVTPEEFMQQAQNIFTKLDTNHDGMLDRREIITLCEPQKPE